MADLSAKRLARLRTQRPGTVAALDIGCSKTTCLIGRPDPSGPRRAQILGSGRQQTRGFNGSGITDMDSLERTIRLAVEDAEREAGEPVSEVILGVSGPQVAACLVEAQIEPAGRIISQRDVRRLHAQAIARLPYRDTEILAAWPIVYTIDRAAGRIRQPVGMIARSLHVRMAVITAPATLVQNLVECVGRAHLAAPRLVASSIAAGFGTLIEDELENGSICIDMGAGVTAISVFINGAPAWLGLVPAGGQHVTADLAQGLGTTFAAAERIKAFHGTADLNGPGLSERVEAARLGDDGRLHASRIERADIARIIAPRVEETFELVRDLLDGSEVRKMLPHRVVLTGGASQLPGIREVASRYLRAPVRLGQPVMAEFLGEALAKPAFSTVTGLLLYPQLGGADAARSGTPSPDDIPEAGGWMSRSLKWLQENF